MIINTLIGKSYVITPTVECYVYTLEGVMIALCSAGQQTVIVAPSTQIEVTDSYALVTESFKGASIGLSADGGGNVARTNRANVFSQPQVFNSVVSLNGGASAPTAKVTAVNLYDTTKLALSSSVTLPVQASDSPVDVLTFTAPSEGVYQVLACLYASTTSLVSESGAGGNKLVSSLVRVNGANTSPLTNALITRFKDVASPFWESFFGTADKVTNFSIYSTSTTYAKDYPYFISFKVETQKLKAGDKLVLQGHGWSSVPANTACMRALIGSFLHVTKLI